MRKQWEKTSSMNNFCREAPHGLVLLSVSITYFCPPAITVLSCGIPSLSSCKLSLYPIIKVTFFILKWQTLKIFKNSNRVLDWYTKIPVQSNNFHFSRATAFPSLRWKQVFSLFYVPIPLVSNPATKLSCPPQSRWKNIVILWEDFLAWGCNKSPETPVWFLNSSSRVPVMAQWVTNPTSIHEDVGLIPGPGQ